MSLEPAALFSRLDLARRAGVVAAVSGGGDSLALLFLLKSFLDVEAPHTRLLAVTVDHGLRSGSAGEARAVAELCRQHGIAHRILEWSGDKPASGVIAAARDARHRLLAQAAAEAGSDLVLTGHTLDDQSETVAMRQARRDEGGGLAGIALATLYDGSVWFCRPLLRIRRAALRDWLARRGVAWIDDPSNANPAFERVRVRTGLRESEIEALARTAAEAGRTRVVLAGEAAGFIDLFASRPAAGLFRLDPQMFKPLTGEGEHDARPRAGLHRDATVLALRAMLATAGGTPQPSDRGRTEALAGRIAAGPLRATLSRAVVDARPGGIWIRREARGLPEVALSRAPLVWDGRWRVAVAEGGAGLAVASIEQAAAPAVTDTAGTPQSLLRAAFSAEPGLFRRGSFVGHAASAGAREAGMVATPLVAPHTLYLPSFDLDLAAALRRLAGLPPLPALPWKDHIAAGA